MHPNTLAETIESIRLGTSRDVTLAGFMETFELAPTSEARFETIAGEPVLTKDKRLDAMTGAIAEYLAKQYKLGRVPSWASDTSLSRPSVAHEFDIHRLETRGRE